MHAHFGENTTLIERHFPDGKACKLEPTIRTCPMLHFLSQLILTVVYLHVFRMILEALDKVFGFQFTDQDPMDCGENGKPVDRTRTPTNLQTKNEIEATIVI